MSAGPLWEWAHPAAVEGRVRTPWMPWAVLGIGAATVVAIVLAGNVGPALLVLLVVIPISGVVVQRVKSRAMRFRIRGWPGGILEIVDKDSITYPASQLTDVSTTIAATGDTGARTLRLTHRDGHVDVRLPGGIGYYYGGPSLQRPDADRLVAAIRELAGLPGLPETPGPADAPAAVTPQPAAPTATTGSAAGHPVGGQGWWWRHPEADLLPRRRARWFGVTAVIVVALMVVAFLSERDADPAGLILSVLFVPGLVALIGFGTGWLFYVRPARFALWVTPTGELVAGGSTQPRRVPLPGATNVDVRLVTGQGAGSGSGVRIRTWQLVIAPAGAKPVTVALPGGGIGARLLSDQEAARLEQALRWYAGLPANQRG